MIRVKVKVGRLFGRGNPSSYSNHHKYTPRINNGGNFCGHDPENPRWHCYQPPLKLLPIQKKTQAKLKEFYSAPDLLPRLTRVLSNGDERSFNNNGQRRQVSSERREHIALVMQWVVGRFNFATGDLGFRKYSDGQTMGIAIDTIADELSLNYSAVQEALSHLYHAGYMDYTERYETAKCHDDMGEIEGYKRRLISIRSVSPCFFIDLGISYKEIIGAQTYAKQKWEQARKKYWEKKSRKRANSTQCPIPELPLGMNSNEIGAAFLSQIKLNLSDPYLSPP